MKIAVINGTNRIGNQSQKVSEAIVEEINKKHTGYLIDLAHFNDIFSGEFLTLNNANSQQKRDITNIIDSEIIIFVVPTYTHGIPAPLKNFFDMVNVEEMYSDKIIGVVSSNSRGHEEGAKQTVEILQSMSQLMEKMAFVIPRVEDVNYENIDKNQLGKFVENCISFKQ